MKTNKPDIIDNIRASILIAIGIGLLIYEFYLSALFFIPSQIAYFKSKDIGNIKEGCLYFVGVNYKSGSIHR